MSDIHGTAGPARAATVLVADDESAGLAAMALVLRSDGYTGIEAANGAQAAARMAETPPDLALLDVNLGDVDGRDLCRSLRRNPALADTFLVLVTGKSITTEDQALGLELGADGYIARPIGNRELLARVRACLRIREAERARRLAEQAMHQAQRLSALGTLVGGAGHEISNPLMGIMGYAELLISETEPGSKARDYATEILQEAGGAICAPALEERPAAPSSDVRLTGCSYTALRTARRGR